jgi:hypothetical protein
MNPKVYYRVYKSPPLALVVSQMNPTHTTQICVSNIHLNVIAYLYLGVPSGLFLSRFPIKSSYTFHFSPFMLRTLTISSSTLSF